MRLTRGVLRRFLNRGASVLSSNAKKPCVICGEQIPGTAKVCSHCANYQDARSRWLRRAVIAGAAIAGLIPLFDAASSLRDMVSGAHRAEVRLGVLSCHPESITLAAMNFGKGPAFVHSPIFAVDGKFLGDASSITLRSKDEAISKVITPGGVTMVELIGWLGTASSDLPRRSGSGQCQYRTTLEIEDAYGTSKKEVKCDCPSE